MFGLQPDPYFDICTKFLEFYYENFNANPNAIANTYIPNAPIDFNGTRFTHFSQLLNHFMNIGVYSVFRRVEEYHVQVIDENTALIQVSGSATPGPCIRFPRHFEETFVVAYNPFDDGYYINNHILHVF